MTAIAPRPAIPQTSFIPRQRDRRRAIGDLLSAVTRVLDRRTDLLLMRGAFEDVLRRIVPVRSVHLRSAGNRWAMAADGTAGA